MGPTSKGGEGEREEGAERGGNGGKGPISMGEEGRMGERKGPTSKAEEGKEGRKEKGKEGISPWKKILAPPLE